ncbi:MAG: YvrJ family protein [Burkholderiales bacterium]
MTADTVIQLIRDIGFPAAIAWFVLVRVEHRLHELTVAVVELSVAMQAAASRPHSSAPP